MHVYKDTHTEKKLKTIKRIIKPQWIALKTDELNRQLIHIKLIMVNRPDSNSSSSTTSTKGVSPSRNATNGVRSSLTRSNSDHDYKDRKSNKNSNMLRNSSSFQNVHKAVNGSQSRNSQVMTPKVFRQRNNR